MNAYTSRTQGMIDLLERLVTSESPSHDKAAVDRVGAIISEECRSLGGQVVIHPQNENGDHIEVRWGPHSLTHQGERGIMLLCHMDTVFPCGTLDKMPFYQIGDMVFGPGVLDMKGGIVIALTVIASLFEDCKLKSRPVTALFTSDEEIGSRTSRVLIESLAKKSSLVMVLEPGMPNGAVKTWRKGVGDFTLRVSGRAAHSGGDHEKGRNAIEELAHQIIAIQKLTDYEKGTTLNVGVVRGGIAPNVVPDEAIAEIDLRVMQPGEAERIIACLYGLKPFMEGTSLTMTGELNRPPMPLDKIMTSTFKKAKEIAANKSIQLESGGTGGASDANFVAPLGIPVLDGLGAIGEGQHSNREYIYADSLPERAELLDLLIREW